MFHKTISNILGLYSSVLVIALLIISPLSLAENRPGFVCGKFNGHVMEVGSLVEVSFTPEKLPQWQAIVRNTQQFLLSHIKNKEHNRVP
ncbi:hypothetical protein [Yersinia enterocolitica]|uniref:hypothetical protein n=1 Tax=Yersinia enterocolitica TaxID=630 RepID=UPI0002E5FC70|nr:hypothetical protein [Yersinia enterocolitica]